MVLDLQIILLLVEQIHLKVNDGKGPEIEILYDDESESSYLVNPNFKLRVKFMMKLA